ncbi:zinc finger C3HC-type protein 1-like [Haemaphysalis longicornis]
MSASKGLTSIECLTFQLPANRKEYDDYKARIQTFIDEYGSQSKWSCKPPELSPSVCARFGWKCVSEDMLCCISCKAHLDCKLCSRLGHKLYKECTEKLVSSLKDAHKNCCPWKAAPCPESYAVMEPVMRHGALEQLRDRLGTLTPILSSLPLLSTDAILKQLGAEAIAKICRLADEEKAEDKEYERAVLLALTGWKTAGTTGKLKQLECEFCYRKVGTWLYASPNDVNHEGSGCKQENTNGHGTKRKHEEEEFDPLKEHRPWCIWVICGSSGKTGWLVYSECLQRNIDASNSRSSPPASVAAFQEKVDRILSSWKQIKVPKTL